MVERCPYSEPPFEELSDDHIFPEFLGGRRTIRICRDCNSRFGHSFEAKAAAQLKRMQVFISHFGLDLTNSGASWPSALEIDGVTYDLRSGPDGVQYELARPVILRNESGEIVGGRARSRREAEQVIAGLIRKGRAKSLEVEEATDETLDGVKLSVDLSYNEDLYRFSTKLVANVAVALGRDTLVRESGIGRYLRNSLAWQTRIGNLDTSAIRKLRPSLSHTVYVEFGDRSHGVVILFGWMEVYVPLPSSAPGAILGFLDPITGEEFFGKTEILGISPPASLWTEAQAQIHFAEIANWLAGEAICRGAKRPPNLSVPSCGLGPPAQSIQISRTTTTFPGEAYCQRPSEKPARRK